MCFELFFKSLAAMTYSQVPIKQIGPNKQVGWIFYVNFINIWAKFTSRVEKQNKIGPNKQVGWEITYDMSKYRVGGKSKHDDRLVYLAPRSNTYLPVKNRGHV